jgi:hypothetical protein
MITNETVKHYLMGAFSSKEGSDYWVILFDAGDKVDAEYFLTRNEALAASDTHGDKLIFLAHIR